MLVLAIIMMMMTFAAITIMGQPAQSSPEITSLSIRPLASLWRRQTQSPFRQAQKFRLDLQGSREPAMVLTTGQQRASGWGEEERLGPHLRLGLEVWLGVFVTAPPPMRPLQTRHRNQLR